MVLGTVCLSMFESPSCLRFFGKEEGFAFCGVLEVQRGRPSNIPAKLKEPQTGNSRRCLKEG